MVQRGSSRLPASGAGGRGEEVGWRRGVCDAGGAVFPRAQASLSPQSADAGVVDLTGSVTKLLDRTRCGKDMPVEGIGV